MLDKLSLKRKVYCAAQSWCSLHAEKLQKVENSLFIFVEVKTVTLFPKEKQGLKPHFTVALLEHLYLTIALLPILLKRHHRHFWGVRLNQKPHNFPKFHVKGSCTFLFIFMCESKSSNTKRLIWHHGSYISLCSPCDEFFPSIQSRDGQCLSELFCPAHKVLEQLPSISIYWSELSVHFFWGLYHKSALRPPCCRKVSYWVNSVPSLYTFVLD